MSNQINRLNHCVVLLQKLHHFLFNVLRFQCHPASSTMQALDRSNSRWFGVTSTELRRSAFQKAGIFRVLKNANGRQLGYPWWPLDSEVSQDSQVYFAGEFVDNHDIPGPDQQWNIWHQMLSTVEDLQPQWELRIDKSTAIIYLFINYFYLFICKYSNNPNVCTCLWVPSHCLTSAHSCKITQIQDWHC